jgi:hypothetical protein
LDAEKSPVNESFCTLFARDSTIEVRPRSGDCGMSEASVDGKTRAAAGDWRRFVDTVDLPGRIGDSAGSMCIERNAAAAVSTEDEDLGRKKSLDRGSCEGVFIFHARNPHTIVGVPATPFLGQFVLDVPFPLGDGLE